MDYARKHFEAEVQLIRHVRCPGRAEHVQEHAEFRRPLRSLMPQWEFEGGSTAMLWMLLGFLESWLTEYVTKSDQRIADHMRQ